MNKGGALTDLSTRTPSGDDVTQRPVLKPAFGDDLLERILNSANLHSAWNRVRANKGAAGVDGMSIDEFLDWAKDGHWKRVVNELETGRYQPSPVRRVEIDKPDGSKRPLGIPCVVDRIIQQAIAQVLTRVFDPDFSESSFGFRPRRSATQAVKQVHSIIKAGRRFAVDVDLSKFFDQVNHDLLMTLLGRKVRDKRVMRLIKRYLRAGVIDNQLFKESREGVPQGGPLSPLLSNIMLDPLDKELERRGHRFARYADDFTILVKKSACRRTGTFQYQPLLAKPLETGRQHDQKPCRQSQRQSIPGIHLRSWQDSMARVVLAEFQARGATTDESQLGCVHALPDLQAQPVPSWLGKLFWHR